MYLKDSQDLQKTLSEAPSSAVVLNKTEEADDDAVLPMSQVISEVLAHPTRSFTALVGFFGHRASPSNAERTLAEVIAEEAKRGTDQTFENTAFRLAVGVNSSAAAQNATRAWYWLCRYRHEAPNGTEETDQLREAFLELASTSFEDASEKLLQSTSTLDGQPDDNGYKHSPFRLAVDEFVEALNPRADLSETRAEIQEAYEETLLLPCREEGFGEIAKILLGFMLQRRGDVRINPKEDVDGVITVFHPKMYVVEQDKVTHDSQTVSIVGSHNWTQSALGIIGETDVVSNVEVATLHVDDDHLWNQPNLDDTLGQRVCGTARHLFEQSDYVLGAWEHPAGNRLLPAHELRGVTEKIGNLGKFGSEKTTVDVPEPVRELAPHLQQLAERLIGLGDLESSDWSRYRDFFEDPDRTTFGYTPAPYQSDAALRLMSMLGPKPDHGSSDGHRGAFLTDETGLGKTIVGQMVTTILLVERLKERAAHEKKVPLRASFIVPARLTGDEQQASGWIGHRIDVENAVRQLLEDEENLNGSSVEKLMGLLDLKVFSIGAFSRTLFDVDDVDDYGPNGAEPFDSIDLKSKVADDFLHIALSEVILMDESHNFRNEFSRRTRTFRFLGSLPLPGEDWRFDTAFENPRREQAENGTSAANESSRYLPIQRRMVCLSATPFNNDVSDLITQMGHFDQYQDWTQAYQHGSRAEEAPQALVEALNSWKNSGPTDDFDELKPHFYTLLRHTAHHLEKNRRLSVREDTKENDQKGDQKATSDYGPRYEWRADHNYVDVLKTVQEWAKQRSDNIDEDQTHDRDRQEVQERMDSLLVKLFVQRSRARVLRMAESSRGEAIDKMFRHPHVPRYPVALNEGPEADTNREASSDFEREVLGGLYQLLGKADEEIGESSDTLSFKSYKIAIRRSRGESEGGSTRPNFLGFQLTGLVKRLQSSPYSFFRTIVRGVLRHALTEIALIEYLVEDLDESQITLTENDLLKEYHSDLENALDDVKAQLKGRRYGETTEEIAVLMGGVAEQKSSPTFFRSLTGCNENADRHETSRINDFEKAVARTVESYSKQQDIEGREPKWLEDLINDVHSIPDEVEGISLLWEDIRTVLKWVEEDAEGGLRKQLYRYIEHEDFGFELGTVRKRCAELVESAPDRFDSDQGTYRNVAKWANLRLSKDPRLRTLISWLMIQASARMRARSTGRPPTDFLRSGVRTLLFTEYTDTQEYLLSVIAALGTAFLPFTEKYDEQGNIRGRLKGSISKLQKQLTEEIRKVSDRLGGWAGFVRSQSVDTDTSQQPFARAEDYDDPIVRSTTSTWLTPLIDGDTTTVAETVLDMCNHIGRICSGSNHEDTAHHLFRGGATGKSDSALTDPDEVTVEGADPDASNAVAENDVVDSFSPWYQIEPRNEYTIHSDATSDGRKDDIESLQEDVRRLCEARQQPVDSLVATEVLAEGVNLQECGVVIHYDLPWNPTRLIQRNGRVDRRINQNYEDEEKRSQLVDRMVQAVEKANKRPNTSIEFDRGDLPIFHKPEQIYHMTVVPPEPELDDVDDDTLVRRVRQRIFLKLETIRSLFGLSTWPVVLDREAARRVLSGELDYETPGFRRREDLFESWRRLRELNDENGSSASDASSEPKSFLVSVSEEFADRLSEAMAGRQDEDMDAIQENWRKKLQAAGLVQSSKGYSNTQVVRSTPELSDLAEDDGFINGVLLAAPESAASKQSGISAWEKRSKGGGNAEIVPRLLQKTEHNSVYHIHSLNLAQLTWDDGTDTTQSPNAPTSPAATAEDILVEFVKFILSGETPTVLSRQDNLAEEYQELARYFDIFKDDPPRICRHISGKGTGRKHIQPHTKHGDDEQASTNIWILIDPQK